MRTSMRKQDRRSPAGVAPVCRWTLFVAASLFGQGGVVVSQPRLLDPTHLGRRVVALDLQIPHADQAWLDLDLGRILANAGQAGGVGLLPVLTIGQRVDATLREALELASDRAFDRLLAAKSKKPRFLTITSWRPASLACSTTTAASLATLPCSQSLSAANSLALSLSRPAALNCSALICDCRSPCTARCARAGRAVNAKVRQTSRGMRRASDMEAIRKTKRPLV